MKLSGDSKKKLRSPEARWLIPAAGSLLFASALPAFASTPVNPEQETLEIAKHLKPIPDEQWKNIAGDKISEKYEIAKGDTLYDISKRLFGDSKYWPKIWALNNGKILNPHMILPGHAINFVPGTGTSLPGVNVAEAEGQPATQTDAGSEVHVRSQEWKLLGPQPWEQVQLTLPPEVDPLGFDSRSRIKSAGPAGFDPPMMAATQKLQSFGLIFAGEKEANFISLQDIVFIHGEGDIHIGQTYSITTLPNKLTNQATDREGFVYPLLGKVKILQQREGAFVGIITNVKTPIERGAILIPSEPKIPDMLPIPGPSSIEGVILLDPDNSTSTAAQHKFVFIDRGSDDGVTPGMVFRNYQRTDPNDSKRATHNNLLINADIMIVQTSAKFSMGLIMSSATYLTEGSNAVLLTDVSDLLKKHGPDWLRIENSTGTPPDELDSLDNGNGLGDKEKRELKQLENWKENHPTTTPSGAPEELPPPPPGTEEALPPPTAPEPGAPNGTPTEAPTPTPANKESQDLKDVPPPPPVEAAPPAAHEEIPPPPPANEPATEPATEPAGGELPPPPPPPGN